MCVEVEVDAPKPRWEQMHCDDKGLFDVLTLSLARPHRRLGIKSSRSASPCAASSASSVSRSLRARSSPAFPLVCWQGALRALPTSTSKISHSLWSPGTVALGALRCSSRARSGFVSRLPEQCCGGSVCFFRRVPPHTFPDFHVLKMCSIAVPSFKTRDEVPLSKGSRT